MIGFFSVFTVAITLLLILCGAALLPVLFAAGIAVVVLSLAAGIIGIVFRLIGGLLLVLVALPLAFATFGIALAVGVAILHAFLPLLLVVGIVWLILHHHRAPVRTLPNAQ